MAAAERPNRWAAGDRGLLSRSGTMRRTSASLACAAVLLAFQPLQGHAEPIVKEVPVSGTQIRYIEQGRGEPVVFVHGGVSDHRAWETQRETVAQCYRFIAIDQRYFGAAPWSDDGSQFSQATHPPLNKAMQLPNNPVLDRLPRRLARHLRASCDRLRRVVRS